MCHLIGEAEVLALVLKKEEADRKNMGDHLKTLSFNELFDMSPGLRHWNAIMRLKSLVVQVFVRNITNNHSPADATALLFGHQHFGTGSGELFDYLGDLTKRVERLQSKGARQTS